MLGSAGGGRQENRIHLGLSLRQRPWSIAFKGESCAQRQDFYISICFFSLKKSNRSYFK